MNDELQGLYLDHRNIERVLEAIAAAVESSDADEDRVRRILDGAIAFLGGYERKAHHRKDETLFRRLSARDNSMREVYELLLEQHHLLVGMEKDIHRSLLGMQSGDPDSRRRLAGQVSAYIEAYRNCMAVEEGSVYQSATRFLRKRDWRQACGRFRYLKDPIFGPDARRSFATAEEALIAYASRHGGGASGR